MKNDFYFLIKSTLRIYQNSILNSLKAIKKSWQYVFFHILIIATSLLMFFIASFFPPLVGGFFLSIYLAFAVSCFMATVLSAYNKDKKDFKNLIEDATDLFRPTLSILFCFFIFNLILGNMSNLEGVSLFIKLLIAVLLNPIIEIIEYRPGNIQDMFQESFEFIRDNFIEWFLPLVFLLSIIGFFEPNFAKFWLFNVATDNPLGLLQYFVINQSTLLFSPISVVISEFVFFILLFRLNLYYSLATSSRRKRIYNERNI